MKIWENEILDGYGKALEQTMRGFSLFYVTLGNASDTTRKT